MSHSRRGRSRAIGSILVVGAIGASISALPAGLSPGSTAEAVSPTAGAVSACLTAAHRHLQFPTDDGSRVDVSIEPDHQGWWSVQATAGTGASIQTLTCTAAPDPGPLGARAASFSVVRG